MEAPDQNPVIALLLPGGLVVLMFMMVLVGATPLMQGVVEEKMQRIAEVLLGSIRPFGLMLGKLIGTVGVSLTLAGVYLGAPKKGLHGRDLLPGVNPGVARPWRRLGNARQCSHGRDRFCVCHAQARAFSDRRAGCRGRLRAGVLPLSASRTQPSSTRVIARYGAACCTC